MLLLADCANKLSDQTKLNKLHKILVIATFLALGFILLPIMLEKLSYQKNLNKIKMSYVPTAAYQLMMGIGAAREFVAVSARC